MREFVVSTESGGDLSQNYIAAHDIRIVPLYYRIAGEEYGGKKELPPEEFYGKMRKGEVATTVACSPSVIEDLYRSIVEAGKDVLQIGTGRYYTVPIVVDNSDEHTQQKRHEPSVSVKTNTESIHPKDQPRYAFFLFR